MSDLRRGGQSRVVKSIDLEWLEKNIKLCQT